jgi:hypothetical protein
MAGQYLGHAGHEPFEEQRRFSGMVAQGHLNERHDAIPEFLSAEIGLVALDDPLCLETFQTTPARRFAQSQLLGQPGIGQPAIRLQRSQDGSVGFVENGIWRIHFILVAILKDSCEE